MKKLAAYLDNSHLTRTIPPTEKIADFISKERLQYLVYAGIALGVLGFSGILYFIDKDIFRRFLGSIDPLFTFISAILLGAVLLSYLLYQGWFAIYNLENEKGLLLAAALAVLFGFIIILVDLQGIFPADLNVPFPASVLYYPAMGFLVEILFHVLPLAMLLFFLAAIFKPTGAMKLIWIAILIVALLEPIFQTITGIASNQYPLWAAAIVGLHIFFINLSQLIVFRRYDFVSMYVFRLVYYLVWHIAWGYIRLKLFY